MLLGKSPHPLPQHGHGGPTARLGASLVPGEAHVGTKSSWVMGHSSSQTAAFGDLGGMSHILKMQRRRLWALQRAHGGAGAGHGGDDCGTFRAGME